MKRILFMAHGVGRHNKGWSTTSVVTPLKARAAALTTDRRTKFHAAQLQAEIQDTEFVELRYDDLLQEFVKRMLQREGDFITRLESAGLKPLAKIFTANAADKSLLRDNVFDVLIYRAMKEHRYMIRKHLALQMYRKINEHGVSGVQYSLMAHSLGTAVLHDTLQEMSTESGSPYALGFPFKIQNLFQVANTSAILRNDYDPRDSNVRSFIGTGDPGYVRFYLDFAHKWDPVAQFFSYKNYMQDQPRKRLTFTTVDHFKAKNIHAYRHYLADPRVYMRVLRALYGNTLVPSAYVTKVIKDKPAGGLGNGAKQALIGKLTPLVKDGLRAQLSDQANGLVTMAFAVKELL